VGCCSYWIWCSGESCVDLSCIQEKSPTTKILFNWNPPSSVEVVQKAFPIAEEDKQDLSVNGVEERIFYGIDDSVY